MEASDREKWGREKNPETGARLGILIKEERARERETEREERQ